MDEKQFMIISGALSELCQSIRSIRRELRLRRMKREAAVAGVIQTSRELPKADPLTLANVRRAIADRPEIALADITKEVFGSDCTGSEKRRVALSLRALGFTKKRGPVQRDGSRPEIWKYTGLVTAETIRAAKRRRRGVTRCKACRAGDHNGCIKDTRIDDEVFPYVCRCDCW